MSSDRYILTEHDIEQFDKLSDNSLSKDEYVMLLARIEADEVFRIKYIQYKKLLEEVRKSAHNGDKLRARFKRLELKQKKPANKLLWISLSIAASIALLVSLWVIYPFTQPNNMKIYTMYKYSDPGLPILMAENGENMLDSAMIAYVNKDYDKTISYLENCDNNDTVRYYRALSFELAGDFYKAQALYNEIDTAQKRFIAYKTVFRQALLGIAIDQQDAPELMLQIAADSANPYRKKAAEIYTLLNKN